MAVTAKSARGAARKPGGAAHRHATRLPFSTLSATTTGRNTASVGKPGHGNMENQRITEVSRMRTVSMAIQANGQQMPAAWTLKQTKNMKGKAS